jgi:hypothetical protein
LVDNISNPIKRMISMIFGAHDELLWLMSIVLNLQQIWLER